MKTMHPQISWLPQSAGTSRLALRRAGRASTLLLGLFVTGCTMVPPDMLPDPSRAIPAQRPAMFTGQTILIAPVTAIGTPQAQVILNGLGLPGTQFIPGQTFHEALTQALRNSNLFGEVIPSGATRYILTADILQQSTLGYGADFKVHYTLSDTRSDGRALWNQDIEATYAFRPDLITSLLLPPSQTQFTALLRASGENITLLIQNLASLPDPGVAP